MKTQYATGIFRPLGSSLLENHKNTPTKAGVFYGGRGGTRTLKPYRQRILSPQRIPIPPLALVGIEASASVISRV
jgi:hypothetical protein